MKKYMNWLVAGSCGFLFGLGMVISGMVIPDKVTGFLDITGSWDISLAFVMGGALLVFMPGYLLLVKPKQRPVMADEFLFSSLRSIDLRLISGAVIFGVGWGMAGICPGPALASLSFGHLGLWVFFASMMVGLGISSCVLCRLKGHKVQEQTV
ncbi:YeeE/YedE family protein [Vibrio mangrovi]|uniref:YeeE/YedE family protein n=1 Tax=Vibrio mangrovi TaxID=474394 RepID=A0A1Y6IVH3_9VIBR|nr:YeeE/YedE family protein [Vibrio mangrovi]MDW6004522.1 YeeE/YedE family protein [Vibrio mangrovi]SMS00810.1 hypothetical protein VIM7927_02081 [Vibrio mangrovi]